MSGFGLGLRSEHFSYVLENKPAVDWFEVISENFMVPGGRPRRILREIRALYPIRLHGVSLSIGSTGPLNKSYLKQLKILADEIQPETISDHLCWTSLGRHNSHDLLPLPYTKESLNHLVKRIQQVQDVLKRPLMLENVSSYVTYKKSEMTEWDFLRELNARTGSPLLLDVNNIYVSSRNHKFLAEEFLNGINVGSIGQMHLAGHTDRGNIVIDTHDHDVREEVWELYKFAVKRFGKVPTMIERDGNIPEFEAVLAELNLARALQKEVLG